MTCFEQLATQVSMRAYAPRSWYVRVRCQDVSMDRFVALVVQHQVS